MDDDTKDQLVVIRREIRDLKGIVIFFFMLIVIIYYLYAKAHL